MQHRQLVSNADLGPWVVQIFGNWERQPGASRLGQILALAGRMEDCSICRSAVLSVRNSNWKLYLGDRDGAKIPFATARGLSPFSELLFFLARMPSWDPWRKFFFGLLCLLLLQVRFRVKTYYTLISQEVWSFFLEKYSSGLLPPVQDLPMFQGGHMQAFLVFSLSVLCCTRSANETSNGTTGRGVKCAISLNDTLAFGGEFNRCNIEAFL